MPSAKEIPVTSRPAPRREVSRQDARPGLVARCIRRIGSSIRWLLLSLLFSIVVECLGIAFWWPDAGLEHSQQMLSKEIEYLERDLRQSIVSADPGQFARGMAERAHHYLFEVTGVMRLIGWLSNPPSASETDIRLTLHRMYKPAAIFVLAATKIVQVFAVRLGTLGLATPVFLLFSLVGLIDGLVQRDLRRWGGGRESSYLYHYAKNSVWKFVLTACVIYLALPISLHPVFIVLPFSVLFAISISVTANTFKKYL